MQQFNEDNSKEQELLNWLKRQEMREQVNWLNRQDLSEQEQKMLEQVNWLEQDRHEQLQRLMQKQMELRKKSHIKGWATKVLPEDRLAELQELRFQWLEKGQPKVWIECKTFVNKLDLLKGEIQIKIENAKFLLFKIAIICTAGGISICYSTNTVVGIVASIVAKCVLPRMKLL
ncbi:hypothetical protein [Nostoc sp. CHAB 5715]|uniref:hypothetical protein n=1 Tax=Nostoc sp. CHAB 5715 TaxID=2780400 RepID=UPI001E5724D0|nr:hypothetical protein [Nostoc sp. CHAB 5715]MCC5623348.1 hypothetical protein [Nostoc sp. CHAB 5715]